MLISGPVYHFIFLKAAREGWPVVSQLVKLMVRDEIAQRDRFMRENLDAMALRVGEMQAKLVKLEAMGERVSGMAGVKTDDLKALHARVEGRPGRALRSADSAHARCSSTRRRSARRTRRRRHRPVHADRVAPARIAPAGADGAQQPPVDGPVGSGFGFRIDPITGRAALHTGLDFPAEVGTPIHAAAGGVVVVSEWHPAYGN